MLRDLHVRNLAVLAEATVEFGMGLNVLTGETGAGKSIVVDSLALLAGGRASSELIRTGADLLSVTGVFVAQDGAWRAILESVGVEAQETEVVVRREISREGPNRVFINDQIVTLGLLGQIAPSLLGIHTQREELGLLSPELQRDWLDRSGGDEAEVLRRRTEKRHFSYAALFERLERAVGNDRLRQERIDLLRFQVGEIDSARLKEGEEIELRQERKILRHAEAIRAALGSSYAGLFEEDGAAVDRLSGAARDLEEITDWEPGAAKWSRLLTELRLDLEEIAAEIRGRLEGVESDPSRLDTVEDRLALVERLCKKYGDSVVEVLTYRQQIAAELEELEGDVEHRDELEAEVARALEQYRKSAAELSERRRAWGEELSERVHRELDDLAMGKARFSVNKSRRRSLSSPLTIDFEPIEFTALGWDRVDFRLAANPGEDERSLASSASGGELSRIYLAVQLAVRGKGTAATTTLVFDEVDSGIGGAQAAALGRKLNRLAHGGQILAVTHLPQLASHADHQFRVHKRVAKGRTHTRVSLLDHEQRVEEIARMLGGKKVTSLSRSHAEELIAAAGQTR